MEVLRCLLLPIEGQNIIVPYAAVAEVVSFQEPKTIPKAPNWLLGHMTWRKAEIPLLSLEKMVDPKVQFQKPNLHVAIMNRMSEEDHFDFVGILLQTVPRMIRARSTDFKYLGKGSKAYELMEVMIREEKAIIPNIKWIEDSLNKVKR
jgi:chemosensory pili system protein ChpC